MVLFCTGFIRGSEQQYVPNKGYNHEWIYMGMVNLILSLPIPFCLLPPLTRQVAAPLTASQTKVKHLSQFLLTMTFIWTRIIPLLIQKWLYLLLLTPLHPFPPFWHCLTWNIIGIILPMYTIFVPMDGIWWRSYQQQRHHHRHFCFWWLSASLTEIWWWLYLCPQSKNSHGRCHRCQRIHCPLTITLIEISMMMIRKQNSARINIHLSIPLIQNVFDLLCRHFTHVINHSITTINSLWVDHTAG